MDFDIDPGLRGLLDQHALRAHERQIGFQELVGDHEWELDLNVGTLRLGRNLLLPAQVLGTVSFDSWTWRWSWANDAIPKELSTSAREARRLGETLGVVPLTEAEFPVEDVFDGHVLALAVSGLLDADAYYRCPHEGGEVYVLVQIDRTQFPDLRAPEAKASHVITELLLALPIAVSKLGVEQYLGAGGVSATTTGRKIRIHGPNPVTITFDGQGRVTELESTVQP